MNPPTCPTRDELNRFVQGTIDDEQASSVSEHLEQCSQCEATVVELEATTDSVVKAARQSADDPHAAEPQRQKAIAKAVEVGRELTGAADLADEQPAPPSPVADVAADPQTTVFLQHLLTSGLMNQQEFAALRKAQLAGNLPSDVQGMARELVRSGKLTKFQAQALYQGRPKGLLFGDYVVLDRIGAGGMGQVFKAEHRRMKRVVAIKVLPPATMKNAEAVRRFQREVEAAARLTHTNIVTAYDAGEQNGMHYLVMEYVDGSDLSGRLKKHGPLNVAEAVDVIIQAARGLAYAHGKGVIHRDIKPGNLLLNGDGTVKILDMGLARFDAASTPGAVEEGLTQSGQVMGTVDYMAPEQALNTHQADARADIYSLGCSLYRLITGENLYDGATLIEKILAHRDRPIPSLRDVIPGISPQLDAVFVRMVAKKPEDRFQTCHELIEALEAAVKPKAVAQLESASLAPEPELAEFFTQSIAPSAVVHVSDTSSRTQSTGPRQSRANEPPWRRRNVRIAAAAAGAVFLALGIWVVFYDKDDNELGKAYVPHAVAAKVTADGPSESGASPKPVASPSVPPADDDPSGSGTVAVSPDGRQVATGGSDQIIRLWDVEVPSASSAAGSEVEAQLGPSRTLVRHDLFVNSIAFSPDGRRIASAGNDNLVRVCDSQTGIEITRLKGSRFMCVAFSPDGRQLVTGSQDKLVRLWDASTGAELRQYAGHADWVQSVAFSPDGAQIVSGSNDQTLRLWDTASGEELRNFVGHSSIVYCVAFSANGKVIASGGWGATVHLWDAETGKVIGRLTGHGPPVIHDVAFSPDGRQVASASGDQTVILWDAESRQEIRRFEGHEAAVFGAAFSPDGRKIASAGKDATVRVWDVETGRELHQFAGHASAIKAIAWSPDGRHIATGSDNRTVRLWEGANTPADSMAEGNVQLIPSLTLQGHEDHILDVATSPDGGRVASACEDGHIGLWDAGTGNAIQRFSAHSGAVWSVAFSPDGQFLASSGGDFTIRFCDALQGHELSRLQGHAMIVTEIAFSPDGQRIASASNDKTARLWDVATGRELRQFLGHENWVRCVAYSPDGRYIATGSRDESLRLWDVETGQQVQQFVGHGGAVVCVAFSPDGSQIASSGGDQLAIVWNAATGDELIRLTGHEGTVEQIAWSPDGRWLVTGGKDRLLRLWDAETGQELATGQGHTELIKCVTFSPDGRYIASGSRDQTVRLWEVATTAPVSQPAAVRISPQGRDRP